MLSPSIGCAIHLGEQKRCQVVIKGSDWVRAPRGGIVDVQVRPGEIVYPGDTIAAITNPFGREVSSVRSPGTGLVPPDNFTLLPGHFVEIHVPEIGTLVNPVVRASELIEKEPVP